MRAVMVMFDSLNRHMLPSYGCRETIAPNFERVARQTVQFDTCYAGSLPCMPARRELHTGRYNFLHRSWGPLEPFDDSMPEILSRLGVHTHLTTDHYHYLQDGGATYHTRYSTWECIRGQEGDPWKGAPGETRHHELRLQDTVNRRYMAEESLHPQTLTFDAGMDFIRRNRDRDSWFLQIEAFDPHEPFFAPEKYQALYPESWSGPEMDWPQYRPVREDPETVAHVRRRYFALLSMCDHSLGRVLDAFDQFGLWQDTMLIVCTDHGYMLGEHGYWAKNYMRPYEEVVHTPLFIWDPRCGVRNERRKALVQTIDLPVTLLSFFGAPVPPDMRGKDLLPVMERDEPVREGALFGWFGRHVGYTDGRYFYVQAPVSENRPLYEYTLLPTRMDSFFPADVLKTMEKSQGFSFTKGLPVMRFEPEVQEAGKLPADDWTVLYDLQADPLQQSPLEDGELARGCRAAMSRLMKEEDAPPEQWQRLGLQEMAADIANK